MGELAKLLGQNIRRERKSKKISQDSLALKCEIDRSYLGRIERGEVNITVAKLYRLAYVLGCSPALLLPEQVFFSDQE